MIKLLRVDHRLLHGQVAFSWTTNLGADCILIANDGIMHDDLRKTTVKLSKPAGTKLVIKNIEDSIAAINSGVTDKYKLFIVVESPKERHYIGGALSADYPYQSGRRQETGKRKAAFQDHLGNRGRGSRSETADRKGY